MHKHYLQRNHVSHFLKKIKCGNKLSKYIFENHDFSRGNFFSILPEGSNFERAEELDMGGILPNKNPKVPLGGGGAYESIKNTDDLLNAFIRDYLSQDSENFSVVEDIFSSPEDKDIKSCMNEVLISNKKVYYLLDRKTNKSQVNEAIKYANEFFHFLIVLTKGPHKFGGILKEEDVKMICDNANYLISTAYDRESYIIWEKSS